MKADFRERYLEPVVGGFVLAAAVVFVGLLAWVALGGRGLTPEVHYRLSLDHGLGITPGIDVTISGLPVGRVQSVGLGADRRVELVLAVDRNYAEHVRTDSVGDATMTLTGKLVRIQGGSADAAVLPDGGELVAGTNFDVFLALEDMDLVSNIQQIQRILEDINLLAEQMELGDGKLPEAMDQLTTLLKRVHAGEGTVGRLFTEDALLDDLDGSIHALDRMAGSVDEAAVAMKATSTHVDGAADSLSGSTDAIDQAAQSLERTAANVDTSTKKLSESLDALNSSLEELRVTLQAIQRLPLVRSKMDDD